MTADQEDAPGGAGLGQERPARLADRVVGRLALNSTVTGVVGAPEITEAGSAGGGLTVGPAASAALPSAALDERLLAAGTALRFALLVMLCVVSGWNLLPGVLDGLFVSNHDQTMQVYCLLAAGVDPASNHQTDFLNGLSNARAYNACVAAYTTNLHWVWVITAVVLLVAVIGMYWFVSEWRGRRSRVVALEAVDAGGTIRLRLSELLYVAGLVDRAPRFVVDPAKATPGAVVFGRGRARTVCLHGGLVAVCESDEQRFRSVVLHELAHIRNKDVGVTHATVTLWRVFLVLVLLPDAVLAARALYLGIIEDPRDGASFNVYNAHYAAVLPLVIVAAYLTRASVLRSREIYADLRAVRWGASSAPWDAAPAGIRLRGWQRVRAAFMEAWRTHPSPALRRQSLSDPRALFAIDAVSMIVTGFAADHVFDGSWFLPSTSNVGQIFDGFLNGASFSPSTASTSQYLPTTEVAGLLVAGLVIAIGGIAQWRAVVYAIVNGRPVPAGWRTGLWLGLGVSIGELVGTGQELDGRWLPAVPEVLLVLVAALVLLMEWIAQNAEWWIRTWHGRSLRPAMLLGLAAPWLVFASILYWWEKIGNELIGGTYSTAGLLSGYGIPGLPPAHIGPSLVMSAVLGVLPGFDGTAGSLWWAMSLLWLVPLSVVMTRPLAGRPAWLVKALPGSGAPLPRHLPDLRRIWYAGAGGALICCAAMAAVMAYVHLHVPRPPTDESTLVLSYSYDLVMCGAAVLTAFAVAAATDAAWLLTALIAAGITSALSLVIVFVLTIADGCLGPFSTAVTKCELLPVGSTWRLVAFQVPYSLMLGVFAGGLAAFAGRGARLLWQRRHASTTLPPTAPATPAPKYLPRHARHATRLLGARVTAILLITAVAAVTSPVTVTITSAAADGNTTAAEATQMLARPSVPSPAIARLEVQGWAEVGGLDLVEDLSAAEKTYYTTVRAAVNIVSDRQYATAVDPSCGDLARATQRAKAFFPVPDPSGQQIWSQTVTDYQRLTTACRNLVTNQTLANAHAAVKADQQAYNAIPEILQWLARMGAVVLGSAAPGTSG